MDPNRSSDVLNPNPPSTDPYAPHYYNVHQSSSYPHYPFQIPLTAPLHPEIPSNHLLLPAPDAALRPPGTAIVSYPSISSSYVHPPPHFSYDPHAAAPVVATGQAGATYYQNPGIGLQYGADNGGYAAAGESVPQIPTTMLSINDSINHPLSSDAIKRSPRSKVVQSLQCVVCKIDCNSKDAFDGHILGKKHQRNLLKQKTLSKVSSVPGVAPIPKIPKRTKKRSLVGEVGQMVLTASDDLETKRQNLVEHGAEVDSVMVCGICNVVCNSLIVFKTHISGKRHAVQAGVIPANGIDTMVHANPNSMLLVNQLVQPSLKKATKRGPKKAKIVQSAWCEICKIDCNSKDVLDQHKLGKKHMKKLEESKTKVIAVASAALQTANNPVIGPPENPLKTVGSQKSKKKAASSSVTEEDLEMKRRKVMEGGAAAEAVRVCTVCNVVCNSDVVFNYHLTGQKHAAMVKKLAAAGSQAVTAA